MAQRQNVRLMLVFSVLCVLLITTSGNYYFLLRFSVKFATFHHMDHHICTYGPAVHIDDSTLCFFLLNIIQGHLSVLCYTGSILKSYMCNNLLAAVHPIKEPFEICPWQEPERRPPDHNLSQCHLSSLWKKANSSKIEKSKW